MRFVFLGERLAGDLLNPVVAQDLLQGPRDVAAWAEAAGVLPHGALRGSAAGQEPERLRGFRETLRRGVIAWAGRGKQPPGAFSLPDPPFVRGPGGRAGTARRGQGVPRRPPGRPARRPPI